MDLLSDFNKHGYKFVALHCVVIYATVTLSVWLPVYPCGKDPLLPLLLNALHSWKAFSTLAWNLYRYFLLDIQAHLTNFIYQELIFFSRYWDSLCCPSMLQSDAKTLSWNFKNGSGIINTGQIISESQCQQSETSNQKEKSKT